MLKRKKTKEVVRALNRLERKYKSNFYKMFKTITVDNGSEFANFKGIEKALLRVGDRVKVYFCHAYSSWERGSNENQNKLIRRHLPKNSDFDILLNRNVAKDIMHWINVYPRAIHNGKPAVLVFKDELSKLNIDIPLEDEKYVPVINIVPKKSNILTHKKYVNSS